MVESLEDSKGVLESLSREIDLDRLTDLKVAADEIKQNSEEVQRLFQSIAEADMKE